MASTNDLANESARNGAEIPQEDKPQRRATLVLNDHHDPESNDSDGDDGDDDANFDDEDEDGDPLADFPTDLEVWLSDCCKFMCSLVSYLGTRSDTLTTAILKSCEIQLTAVCGPTQETLSEAEFPHTS